MQADLVRAHFDYDPETGVIERRDKSAKRRSYTGTVNHRKDTSYACLCLNGKKLYAHRVAWMCAVGDIPPGMVIDHIDNNGLNNRLSNLRVVTKSANQRNRRDASNGRIAGVHRHRGGFSVQFLGKHARWTKDFLEACCIRKSLEAKHGYIIERSAS
jgi:hypothetical protein